jgi:hypothetical protein
MSGFADARRPSGQECRTTIAAAAAPAPELDRQRFVQEIPMNAKNTFVRLVFALASALTTAVSLGSVLALAEHYTEAAQWAAVRPVVIAQR